mgnify:FL=1
MTENLTINANDHAKTQELQHLITVSTGFIDAYIIQCFAKAPMLLPQNVVLSALDSQTHVNHVEWHDKQLPVFHVNNPDRKAGVALVIEGEEIDQRFALMCEEMPTSIRIRISEVVDDDLIIEDQSIMQYVRIGAELFHVPDLAYIQSKFA